MEQQHFSALGSHGDMNEILSSFEVIGGHFSQTCASILANLLHALRRNNNPTATREVCATTNSVLASIFKGQTRWSCAILSNMICQWK
ncbi:hypothetical protein JHK82_031725 [Glycine max]|nr:hypothetical protein JHK82_031725 [Glycine max]KAG5146417.1 hypothetical protein JHK84_031960 [Glycine max]